MIQRERKDRRVKERTTQREVESEEEKILLELHIIVIYFRVTGQSVTRTHTHALSHSNFKINFSDKFSSNHTAILTKFFTVFNSYITYIIWFCMFSLYRPMFSSIHLGLCTRIIHRSNPINLTWLRLILLNIFLRSLKSPWLRKCQSFVFSNVTS